MRRSLTLALAALVLLAPPRASWSQEPVLQPPRPTNPTPPPSNQNVRVDVTITLKGDKPLSKTLSMVAADGKETKARAGIEIPVPQGSFTMTPGASAPAPMTFTYRGVGVNVDATPQILDGARVMLRLSLNFSTVYRPEGTQSQQPSFGQGSHEVRGIVFESGKPVVVTRSADGETGRDYTVEVKATILK